MQNRREFIEVLQFWITWPIRLWLLWEIVLWKEILCLTWIVFILIKCIYFIIKINHVCSPVQKNTALKTHCFPKNALFSNMCTFLSHCFEMKNYHWVDMSLTVFFHAVSTLIRIFLNDQSGCSKWVK